MDPLDVISFSLLSERTNKLSKSLRKISINSISAFVKSDYPRITVALNNDMSVGLHLYTEILPGEVNVMLRNGMISWEKGSITVAKLVERILEVTSCESLEYVILRGPLQLEVCDTLTQLSKLQKLVIDDACSDSFAKKALEIILPVTTDISLYRIPFESRKEFQTFLKSNLNELYIHSQFSTFTLDDFLVTNALKVELRQVLFSATDISQFLTNWFHSKHNSRLEHLSLLETERERPFIQSNWGFYQYRIVEDMISKEQMGRKPQFDLEPFMARSLSIFMLTVLRLKCNCDD
ncbi:hypothetical protein GCK72_021219 [Caenorhabditis remanei]|uniref:Sdz-33 F-box domain-containing protein n=1 Tax=Caenorhabditis remanei TaxID=31234 RepID=A0A6A5GJ55_CAERE|nr:hypothetical protein GCK72_021219 [Caenorhabditis remanei]KAF1754656.1 hypothetical protein GCK72_021219 [Caenorhabditis remanei]